MKRAVRARIKLSFLVCLCQVSVEGILVNREKAAVSAGHRRGPECPAQPTVLLRHVLLEGAQVQAFKLAERAVL